MRVQGSPIPAREIRFVYSDEAFAVSRSGFPREIEPEEEETAPIAPAPREKEKWSFSNALLGNCPEFFAAFSH